LYQFLDAANVFRDTGFHRRRNPNGLMDSAEIVEHELMCNCMAMIVDFL